MELESDTYDVVVIGTGLAESIAAAALAKTGKSVLHLDPNEYYGGEQASLTLDELEGWCHLRSNTAEGLGSGAELSFTRSTYMETQRGRYTHASTSKLDESLTSNRRRYALSLFPAVLPSRGPLISTLISSGVSKYVSFRILDSVSIWQEDQDGQGAGASIRRVPGSKEQVFKDKEILLMDKRRLMKFLMFAAGEFEDSEVLKGKEKDPFPEFLRESFTLVPNLADQITYAIAHCSSPEAPTLDALLRTRRYLKSIGRYGTGAFLVGQYGGAGEIAQGFCRACAVFGGTYVLGKDSIPESMDLKDGAEYPVKLKIPCHPRPISAKHLICSPDHLPSRLRPRRDSTSSGDNGRTTAHCIALLPALPAQLKRPEKEKSDDADADAHDEDEAQDDTAVIVFPPQGERGLVRALVMGEGTGSCPSGQFVLYLSSETAEGADPTGTLQPYLHRLSPEPLFQSFYSSRRPSDERAENEISRPIVVLEPYKGAEVLTEGLDWEAEQGEKAFWSVVGGKDGAEEGKGFFDKTDADEPGEDDEL